MDKDKIKNLALSAMFFAMGIVIPFVFGQIPQVGSMLLPMHIPVFLCAFVCGWKYAVPMAVLLPIFRSVIFGRPNMYPEAVSIAFEMAAYAFIADFLYNHFKRQCMKSIYNCLFISMITGRIVRCIVQLFLLRLNEMPFTITQVLTGVIITGIPGIILQLILIPTTMFILNRTKLIKFKNTKDKIYS